MHTTPHFGIVVEYVKNVEEAKQFYVDVLGLRVERAHPQFVQFDKFCLASDEPMGGKAETEIYWVVDDAESAFQELSQKATILRPLTQMPFGKVFAIKDPAGRPCLLLEWAKERPSQTAQ